MICKNCGKEIRLGIEALPNHYIHLHSGYQTCRLFATPILGHINRHLDAKQILADLESRQPKGRVVAPKPFNPDLGEGVFVGKL